MLSDITVINLASVGPAARAAQLLADFGAAVLRIAPPGDAGKQIEPAFYAYGAGRGTAVLRLDLKVESDLARLRDLAGRADVLIESFRPGVAARLGLGYPALSTLNPGLVYCSTSGYGQEGPYAGRAGHDINYLAMGGLLDNSGRDAGGCPALPGATVGDSAGGGMQAGLSILAALLARHRDGRGRHLDVAVVDGVLSLMALPIDQHLATGATPTAGSDLLTGRYAWYGAYPTADGRFLALGAIEPKFYRNLCTLLGLDQYAGDQYRDERQPALRAALRARLLQHDRDHWVRLLADADTCVSPVLSVAEVTADPHLGGRGSFTTARHPDHGEFRQLAPMLAGAARLARVELDPTTTLARVARAFDLPPEALAPVTEGYRPGEATRGKPA